MPHQVYIQSFEGRQRAMNRFCYITAAMASVYVLILAVLRFHMHAVVMTSIVGAFVMSAQLNKHKLYLLSRCSILLATNFSVFYFSALLGFWAGIHLYLFTAPLICYMLYDFDQRKKILLAFLTYLSTFLVIFWIHRLELITPIPLDDPTLKLLYVLNFCFSLILCFSLIIYFAFNNSAYIKMLVDSNRRLEEKHKLLQEEMAGRSIAQEAVVNANKEKDVLLHEIHHRVKNNLAVISGLVELQNFYIKDEKASSVLKESRNRIKSIAVLHEKLYENKNIEKIDVRSYVDELLYFIRLNFSSLQKQIHIHTQIDKVELGLSEALPFSLLLNELITNSHKHAFRERNEGNIILTIRKTEENALHFHYKDDGAGFEYSNYPKDGSLGLNLIEAFGKQLKGKATYESMPDKGVEYKLQFRLS